MDFKRNLLRFFAFLIPIVMLQSSLFSADYKVGEEVEVFFLQEWRPATVVQVNTKGLVRAEFEFAAAVKQEVFQPDAVRKKYESGAIWRGRMWSDKSGSFKMKAALLRVEPDKVFLRKEDGKELSVEIEKLSVADQKFLQKMRTDAGGGTPLAVAPQVIEFDTSAVYVEAGTRFPGIAGSEGRSVVASDFRLEADPQKASLSLPEVGTKLPAGAFGDQLDTLIPLGGKDGWCMASLSNVFGATKSIPMRVHWAALAKGTVGATQVFPAGESVLDYHAPSKQILTYGRQGGKTAFDGDIVLTIWNCSPASNDSNGVIAWMGKIGDSISYSLANPWARFISATMVLQRGDNHRLVVWDTEKKRVAWSAVQESFFAPEPLLSHGGKYLFVPEDLHCRILDPQSGRELGRVSTEMSCSAVSLAADGKTLAILTNTQLIIVNLTDSKDIRVVDASTIGTPFGTTIEWVTEDLIAVPEGNRGFILYSLSKGVPIWSYQFDHDVQQSDIKGGKTHAFVKGSMSYAVEVPLAQVFVVGAVAIPDKEVAEMVSKVDPKSYMLMGPSTAVQLKVNVLDSEATIRQVLEEQIKANSWTISAGAPYTVTATLKRGEAQTVQYESMSSKDIVSVTTTPYISAYEIRRGEDLLWSSASSSGVPPVILFGEGTPQEQASKWENADYSFFTRVDIPQSVMDPAKKRGLGESSITNRGVVKANR